MAGFSLFGSPSKIEQISNQTPGQQNLQGSVINQALTQLQNPQNFDFNAIANKARSNFETKTVPLLAERFTSMGNGRRSSAFEGAIGSAGAGLEESLAGMQAQYGPQLLQLLLGAGLNPSMETFYSPETSGLFGGAAGGIGQGAGTAAGLYGASKLGSLFASAAAPAAAGATGAGTAGATAGTAAAATGAAAGSGLSALGAGAIGGGVGLGAAGIALLANYLYNRYNQQRGS